MPAADALYVPLAVQLGASLLTDDHRLAQATTALASPVSVLRPSVQHQDASRVGQAAGGKVAATASASW